MNPLSWLTKDTHVSTHCWTEVNWKIEVRRELFLYKRVAIFICGHVATDSKRGLKNKNNNTTDSVNICCNCNLNMIIIFCSYLPIASSMIQLPKPRHFQSRGKREWLMKTPRISGLSSQSSFKKWVSTLSVLEGALWRSTNPSGGGSFLSGQSETHRKA